MYPDTYIGVCTTCHKPYPKTYANKCTTCGAIYQRQYKAKQAGLPIPTREEIMETMHYSGECYFCRKPIRGYKIPSISGHPTCTHCYAVHDYLHLLSTDAFNKLVNRARPVDDISDEEWKALGGTEVPVDPRLLD